MKNLYDQYRRPACTDTKNVKPLFTLGAGIGNALQQNLLQAYPPSFSLPIGRTTEEQTEGLKPIKAVESIIYTRNCSSPMLPLPYFERQAAYLRTDFLLDI